MPFTDVASGNLTATTGDASHVDLPTGGYRTAGIRISGTFVGTITFQGSVDGSQYDTLTVTLFDGTTVVTTATAAGQWRVGCGGLRVVRCQMTAYTSGTAVVFMLGTADS